MRSIDTATQLCAVIGNPVGHSLSPAIHNAAFEVAGLNFAYLAFHVEDVGACLTGMRALPSFRGMSVTIPHKRAVMDHLDEIEPMARHVGSVNTITNEGGRLIGSTTDGPGAVRAFTDAAVDLSGKQVVFIGSGGAVRAVAFAVAELTHAKRVTILGRTPDRVDDLVSAISSAATIPIAGGAMDDLERTLADADVIIQGTSVGMIPNANETCIPAELLAPHHVVFDMVYRPNKTRLIHDAEARRCKTILGIEMLINQAVLQFQRWTGVPAPYEAMRSAALTVLARE